LTLAETSNRGTTHQRSKIGQKAAETRKKTRRATKKDVTWKSSEFGFLLESWELRFREGSWEV